MPANDNTNCHEVKAEPDHIFPTQPRASPKAEPSAIRPGNEGAK